MIYIHILSDMYSYIFMWYIFIIPDVCKCRKENGSWKAKRKKRTRICHYKWNSQVSVHQSMTWEMNKRSMHLLGRSDPDVGNSRCKNPEKGSVVNASIYFVIWNWGMIKRGKGLRWGRERKWEELKGKENECTGGKWKRKGEKGREKGKLSSTLGWRRYTRNLLLTCSFPFCDCSYLWQMIIQKY